MVNHSLEEAFVTTIPERCRTCYTCVRECPAKAIRIVDGQAEVLASRCIACGNCVRVCSQGAKRIRSTVHEVTALLRSDAKVAAMIAPSFPASFSDFDHTILVGMIRQLGFDYVHEVAFGADLVAREYRELLEKHNEIRYIATSCPAIVGFVERYHPSLTGSLAPTVSPMVAMARVLRELHGAEVKCVFIGPCIAKKCEVIDKNVDREVAAATTFKGIQELLDANRITPNNVEPTDFDPPHGDLGALFPISRGMLQAANVDEDLITGEVVAADGREDFVEALKEFDSGAMDVQLLEILACNGCIMGPGMVTDAPLFRRRSSVSQYMRESRRARRAERWQADMQRFANIDMSRGYTAYDQRIPDPPENDVARVLAKMGKITEEDELNCGACGYDTCREHAIAILKGLAESEMCLPYMIDQLNRTVRDLGISSDQLSRTQEALLQSEKLASMGQLAAGIAHELNNPLGVVLLYAHLLLDEADAQPGSREDLALIAEQADRCKKIVAGLLHFARQNKVLLEPRDIRSVIETSLRASLTPACVTLRHEYAMEDPIVDIDQDQIVQVLTNLASNAYAAMPEGGELTISTTDKSPDWFEVGVTDTGSGISPENMSRIFEPFFSTKEIGMGTGLGLAVAYGIVKMHRGDLRVESNADPDQKPTGSTFTVTLPRHAEETR
jgi:signal transduction histidine kinase/iron only hydrogenase large subunit-like protein